MAKISFVIPCEANWTEGIYQLEVSDLVLGYDPVLATDGPANQQWKELGDRTLYLRKILDAEHENGHHNLTADNFLPDTNIPESKLNLDYGTADLSEALDDLESRTEKAIDLLSQRNSEDISAAGILGRLLPWIQEYFDSGASFDLLNATSTLRIFRNTPITSEIAGDDSLDVVSTSGVVEGQTYFLMDEDGGNCEEAEVLSVLTDTRIRFTKALSHTRASGILSSVNIMAGDGATVISRDFIFYSSWNDTLQGADSGKLHIHRDNSGERGRVFWKSSDLDDWHEAEFIDSVNFYDGTVDDIFLLPAKGLRFKVEYTATGESWKIYWLALKAVIKMTLPETVRQPEILNLELSGQRLTVRGNPYASLWDIPQGKFELRINSKNNYAIEPARFGVFGASTGMSVNLAVSILAEAPLMASIRYTDSEGSRSRWSEALELPKAN